MNLTELPVELIQLIACHTQSIDAIMNLAYCNKFLYRTLRDPSMATLFSQINAPQLTIVIRYPTEVGPLDELWFGGWQCDKMPVPAFSKYSGNRFMVPAFILWQSRIEIGHNRRSDTEDTLTIYTFDCDLHGRLIYEYTQVYSGNQARQIHGQLLANTSLLHTLESRSIQGSFTSIIPHQQPPSQDDDRYYEFGFWCDRFVPKRHAIRRWSDWHCFKFVEGHEIILDLDVRSNNDTHPYHANQDRFDFETDNRQNWWNEMSEPSPWTIVAEKAIKRERVSISRNDIEWSEREFQLYLKWFQLSVSGGEETHANIHLPPSF